MINNYLLTIAIPTYNRSHTLKQTLDSILPQYNSSVEILIMDDFSLDNTEQIVHEYQKKYSFIRYIRNEKRLNMWANCFTCLEYAAGKFVLILSDDDILLDDAINIILDLIKQHPDTGLMYLNSVGFREKNKVLCNFTKPALKNYIIETTDKNFFLKYIGCRFTFLSTLLYNRQNYNIETLKKYVLDSFGYVRVAFECVKKNNSNMIICGIPCIGARMLENNENFNLRYSVYDVTVERYRKLCDHLINIGCNKTIVEHLFFEKILTVVAYIIRQAKLYKRKHILKHPWKLIKYTYMNPKVWTRVYPEAFLPGFLVKKLYNR